MKRLIVLFAVFIIVSFAVSCNEDIIVLIADSWGDPPIWIEQDDPNWGCYPAVIQSAAGWWEMWMVPSDQQQIMHDADQDLSGKLSNVEAAYYFNTHGAPEPLAVLAESNIGQYNNYLMALTGLNYFAFTPLSITHMGLHIGVRVDGDNNLKAHIVSDPQYQGSVDGYYRDISIDDWNSHIPFMLKAILWWPSTFILPLPPVLA